jgi:hypothetical protein
MAAMTWLSMVNRVRREAGVSGSNLITLGGTLAAENTRIKDWVDEAWIDIQRLRPDWNFMLSDFAFNTTIGVGDYTAATLSTPLTRFKNWKKDTFRAYLTATGFPDEQIVDHISFSRFRDMYLFGNMRSTTGRPVLFSIDQDKHVRIGPVPDAVYTINGQYYRLATGFAAEADTPQTTAPLFEEDFHMLIVWKALESYGLYESAPEVLLRAQTEAQKIMSRLTIDEMPQISYAAPLA